MKPVRHLPEAKSYSCDTGDCKFTCKTLDEIHDHQRNEEHWHSKTHYR
jgi:hypothetical protein